MKNKLKLLAALTALALVSGCNKKELNMLNEKIEKIDARLAAIEKLIHPPSEQPQAQEKPYDISLDDSPTLGNKDARVAVVVFSNFQCPYCARADKSLRDMVKNPDLKDKVKVVFKHFPFERHPEARPAAKAAMAAGEQGKFWEMSDKIFANQNDLSQNNYKKWAKEIGLDVNKFSKDLKDNDKKYDDLIERDIKLGAENAKLQGTPWILVNGWLLEGNVDAASIKKMIEEKKL